ncbi:hypothetical protein T265_06565 [Opisthorchis viverrini]|uniref:Uncharacterized protein n=1 Tax=Opisthorchis viverrini TaxID=6198 RepID=A0A075ADP2_OPIVI|nr:hypothetical protein T265_06565 [Opisthorchis viverrini]KER26154.1 hypothetical protein T265_06565 [Opisthorchis viverrini]
MQVLSAVFNSDVTYSEIDLKAWSLWSDDFLPWEPKGSVHTLQSCCITHDARCACQNRVARELAKRLL